MSKDQNEEVWDLLRSIQKKMRNHLDETYKKHGISVQEALLLRELSYYPDICLNELSDRLGLSKSTVSSMIARMEDQGMIIRKIPDHNRRIIQLSIAPAYSQRPEVILLKDELIAGIVKKANTTELGDIIEGLRKLEHLMEG